MYCICEPYLKLMEDPSLGSSAAAIRNYIQQRWASSISASTNMSQVPAVVAVSMATGLLVMQPSWLQQGWMHAKLGFVGALLAYHFFCYRLMGQLHAGTCQWSGKQLRALNELPTLLLVIVVMLVVFKTQFPTSAATWFIVALVVFMAASIQFYARWRRLRAEAAADA